MQGRDLELVKDDQGVYLRGAGMTLRVDFSEMLPRLKPERLHKELLVKAVKLKGVSGVPVVVDATAGLGEDALLLAAAGWKVLLFENDPTIAELLKDGMRRAALIPELADAVSRMEVHEADSAMELPHISPTPDVVYLDPMFPMRRKSAAVKKKFQLLQRLEAPPEDAGLLLQAAQAAHPKKIVIKRPLKGPYLAEVKPDYSLKGKAIRFDCMVCL
jgi:16S rRNA (guanine1516-N2)-methyltransferase